MKYVLIITMTLLERHKHTGSQYNHNRHNGQEIYK